MVKVHTCVPIDGNSLLMDSKDKFVTHADYKALEEDRDAWRRLAEDFGNQAGEQKRLTAELAECRADAERYRMFLNLLDPDMVGGFTVYYQISPKMDEMIYSDDDMNEKLDNAIARSKT